MNTIDQDSIPHVTTDQMREVDRAMVDDYGIGLVMMMENAGRNLAHLAARRFLQGDPRDKCVVVLAGTGGNGGGGLVSARHLANRGAAVHVVTTKEDADFKGIPARQLAILRRMGVPIEIGGAFEAASDLIIDAIIGYSLKGSPTGVVAELIRRANEQAASILSLDTPSGLDTTTGEVYEPSVRAAATMTLALPKTGFRSPAASAFLGELYLADIGVPPGLYRKAPLELRVRSIFSDGDVVRLA